MKILSAILFLSFVSVPFRVFSLDTNFYDNRTIHNEIYANYGPVSGLGFVFTISGGFAAALSTSLGDKELEELNSLGVVTARYDWNLLDNHLILGAQGSYEGIIFPFGDGTTLNMSILTF